MLTERLGSDRDRIEDLVQKIHRGPLVNGESADGMRRLIEELWDWTLNMEILGRLPEIDTFLWVGIVADRLTGKLERQYQHQVHEYKQQHHMCPGIVWVRSLLEDELEILNWNSGISTREDRNKTSQRDRMTTDKSPTKRVIGLAAAADQIMAKYRQGRKHSTRLSCLLCLDRQASHPIYASERFKNMTVPMRREWVKRVKLCYVC